MNETTKQLHQQANEFLDNNNLNDACSIYQKICQLDDQDAEAYMMLGALNGEMGQIASAIKNLELSLQIDSEYPDAYHTLAQLLRHQGDYEAALKNARKAVEYDSDFFEACNLLASLNGQLGHYKEAEDAAKQALNIDPGHTETRLILANALIEQELFEEAVKEFKQILSNSPGNAQIYSRLGAALSRIGNNKEASLMLKKSIDMNPAYKEARQALAYIEMANDNFEAAAQQYKELIEIDPDSAENWVNLLAIYEKSDNWDELSRFCELQSERLPYNKHILLNKGYAQEKLGNLDNAREIFFKLSELYPDWGDVWNRLGFIYISVEENVPASKYFKKAIQLGVKSPLTLCMYATTLRFFGRYDESEELCKQAMELAPELAPVYMHLGTTQIMLGRHDEALATFKAGLSKHPDDLNLIAGIADLYERQAEFEKADEILKPYLSPTNTSPSIVNIYAKVCNKLKRGEEALDLIEAELEKSSLLKASSRQLHFRCADIYHSAQNYEKAIEHYHKGNALKELEYNQEQHTRFVDDTIRCFSRERLETLKPLGNPSVRPIFILGMPRSGTSLAEQILASHPNVYGAGELMNIARISTNLGISDTDTSRLEDALSVLDERVIASSSGLYLDSIDAMANGEKKITDKMPGNFLRLGLIQILFPNAKIIHTRRNPLDNCLSCYCLDFLGMLPYTYDLSDLGHYYREYERLMAHWHDVLDIPILDVQYEDAVENIENTSKKMIAHCGLSWDDSVLNYHQSKRIVKTASYDQVNKPIYKTSVERWRAYEKWLDPLKDELKN